MRPPDGRNRRLERKPMPRSRQLKTAQRLFGDDERRKAQTLADSERQVNESEAKLAELKTYRADYLRDFANRAGGGMSAASARGYQTFIARLDEALREQTELVTRAHAQRAEQLSKWRGAARRSAAVERVVQRTHTEEQRVVERREQVDTDERAQRRWAQGVNRRAR
jgi:flagellar FliJ protein